MSKYHACHDDAMPWKLIPCYWPLVQGSHWSPVGSPHKVQVKRGFQIFFDLRLNNQFNKRWSYRLFETPRNIVWRQSDHGVCCFTCGIMEIFRRRSCSPRLAILTPSMMMDPLAASTIRNRANVMELLPAPVRPTIPIWWKCMYVLALIPPWINNYIHHKEWDAITNPSPSFNGGTIKVWECISNCTHHIITYPSCGPFY